MEVVLERKEEEVSPVSPLYQVGERVIFIARVNSPKHFMPGQKLPGRVIHVFDNNGKPTYRLELDLMWREHAPDMPLGERIVVGNILGSALLPEV